MKPISAPTKGKRHRIPHNGNDYYLFVSDKSVMFFGPGESDLTYQQDFKIVNFFCRFASKARVEGMRWADIVEQYHKAEVIENTRVPDPVNDKSDTVVGEIIRLIEVDYCLKKKKA